MPRVVDDLNTARQLVGSDFKLFLAASRQIEGHAEYPAFHDEIADWQQGLKPEHVGKTKKLMGFRLAAKSYVAARKYVQWRWLRNPYMQVLLHSSTDPLAGDMVRAILNDMRNNPLMEHLCPIGTVSATQFNLRGITHELGFSIKASGINSSLTGSRCDLYIFDDPEPEIEPESMRGRIISAFGEAKNILHEPGRHLKRFGTPVMPAPERTQLVVIGQPHCDNSAYIETDEDKDEQGGGHPLANALELVIPVITAAGEWTWPWMMNRKYHNDRLNRAMTVDEVRREFTTVVWERQMLCNMSPTLTSGSVLKMQHVQIILRTPKHPICSIDPADGGACETGVCIGGEIGNQIHLCFMGGWHGDAYEGDIETDTLGESIWRQIFDICEEFRVRAVLIEKNYKAAIAAARRYLIKTGRHFHIIEHHATGNKLRRLCMGMEQPINNGIVTANPEVMRDPKNHRQFTGLRFDKLPAPCDRIDAVEQLISHIIDNSSAVQSGAGMISGMVSSGICAPSFARNGSSSSPHSRLHG